MVLVVKLHTSWKLIILIELQLSCNELHWIYDELQLLLRIRLLSIIHSVKIQLVVSGHYNSKIELQG
jgi:hypothetical protein